MSKPLPLQMHTSAEMEPLERVLPAGYTESYRDMARSLYVTLLGDGAAPDSAARLALAQCEALGRELGGATLYIPNGAKVRAEELRDSVIQRFKGANHKELAREYGVTEMRIRQIVKADDERRRLARKADGAGANK